MEVGICDQAFPETRWTLIQRARTSDDGMDEWCRSYMRPVRDYLRAKCCRAEDAEDLAQEFFRRLLSRGGEKGLPARLDGAFRAYLKRSLVNFMKDQNMAGRRERRGGGALHLELDEGRHESKDASPDLAFERGWVLTVLEKAAGGLEREMEASGKGGFFKAVSGCLDGSERGLDRQAAAEHFGMSDGAFRVALHRLRQRFRHLVEEELRETVGSVEDLEEEIRYLLSIWS